jgi:hypothetical protein
MVRIIAARRGDGKGPSSQRWQDGFASRACEDAPLHL